MAQPQTPRCEVPVPDLGSVAPALPDCEPRSLSLSLQTSSSSSRSSSHSHSPVDTQVDTQVDAYTDPGDADADADADAEAHTNEDAEADAQAQADADPSLVLIKPARPFFLAAANNVTNPFQTNTNRSSSSSPASFEDTNNKPKDPSASASEVEAKSEAESEAQGAPVRSLCPALTRPASSPTPSESQSQGESESESESTPLTSTSTSTPTTTAAATTEETEATTTTTSRPPSSASLSQRIQTHIVDNHAHNHTPTPSPMSHSNTAYSPLDSSPPPLPIPAHTHTSTHPSQATSTSTSPPTNPMPNNNSNVPNTKPLPIRPPPSSFAYTYAAFPFQAYPGNPDPGLSIPGFTSRRRSSLDSYNGGGGSVVVDGVISKSMSGGGGMGGMGMGMERDDITLPRSGSLSDLRKPFAPFMAGGGGGGGENNSTSSSTSLSLPRSNSSNSLYKQSAAANLNLSNSYNGQFQGPGQGGQGQGQGQGQGGGHNGIPRNASTHSFRAPFLAPSSRPTSSLWAPPTYNTNTNTNTNTNATNSPNPNANITTNASPNGNNNGNTPFSPNASTTALAAYTGTYAHAHAHGLKKSKPPLPSTLLRAPIPISEKPWLAKTSPDAHGRTKLSYYLTFLLILLGALAAGIQCYTGLTSVNAPIPANRLCMVMDEDFAIDGTGASALDTGNWNVDVELSGYGNGEFEMTTGDGGNLYVQNGELYVMPTLTSDKVQGVLDGGTFTLEGCTAGGSGVDGDGGVASVDPGAGNKANGGQGGGGGGGGGGGNGTATGACTVTSSDALGTVINPVQSARINTRGKKSIRFGKVEVRAKLPRGDWLWPQIFLLPSQPSPYGAWPVSGELDLLLARGNDPSTYPAQGNTFVRSSLSFGPLPSIASSSLLHTTFGFLGIKHPNSASGPGQGGGKAGYTESFHTYTMEWTEEFIRFSVDRPTHAVLEVSTRARKPQFSFSAKAVEGRSYWNQAGFPQVARGVGGVGGGGGGAPNVGPAGGTATGNGNNATNAGGTSGSANGTDASGANNSTSSANGANNTNTTFARALSHSHLFPVINNTTHTNSSSSSPPSPSPSNINPNTNPNANGNPDTITPITNPYTSIPSSTPSAPFDQPFYLVVNLAVGGTSGWFPDGVGGKTWFDGSATAMRDFARAQDTWYKTWPASAEDRALRIDYIKMWELC